MRISSKIFLFSLFFSLFVIHPTASYAWWHEDVVVVSGPGPYYYPYHPYHPYPAYAVVSTPDFQPVVINGVTYYINNGVYYTYTQYGYLSVAAPAGAVPLQTAPAAITNTGDTVTINVPNDQGGYTQVVLKKSGSGYIGPQGEFYPQIPSLDQLKVMYGK